MMSTALDTLQNHDSLYRKCIMVKWKQFPNLLQAEQNVDKCTRFVVNGGQKRSPSINIIPYTSKRIFSLNCWPDETKAKITMTNKWNFPSECC